MNEEVNPAPKVETGVYHAPWEKSFDRILTPFEEFIRRQMFGVTGVAAHPQKTVLETTAFEVTLKFPLNISRQLRTLYRQMG